MVLARNQITIVEQHDGAQGKGVESVLRQYNISKSKTTPPQQGWINNPPQWSPGNYIWTRLEITYTDKSKTYTTPICDTSWEAVNNLQVGGTNLLVRKKITRNKYLLNTGHAEEATRWFCSDYIPIAPGEQHIKSGFSDLGLNPATCFYDAQRKFISGVNNGNDNRCVLMTAPQKAAYMRVSGLIADLPTYKVERGNVATAWSPAPEDVTAWNIFPSVAALTFETNDKGSTLISPDTIEITALYGDMKADVNITGVSGKHCTATKKAPASIGITRIEDTGMKVYGYNLPYSSGDITITGTATAGAAETTFKIVVPWTVNIHRAWYNIKQTTDEFNRQVGKFNGAEETMAALLTEVRQTAEYLQLIARQESAGYDNMLLDTAFERELLISGTIDSPYIYGTTARSASDQCTIVSDKNKLVNGHKFAMITQTGVSSPVYRYLKWFVRLEPDTTYTLSFLKRQPSTDTSATSVEIWQIGANLARTVTTPVFHKNLENTDAWVRESVTFKTPASPHAATKQYEISFFLALNGSLNIAEPILTKTDVAVPWIEGAYTRQAQLMLKADAATLAVYYNNLIQAGIILDGANSRITAVGNHFEIENKNGERTFEIDEEGNIVGVGKANFLGAVIAGQKNGQRIELNPENKSLTVFNDNNEIVSVIEGNIYASLSRLIAVTSLGTMKKVYPSGYVAKFKEVIGTVTHPDGSVTQEIEERENITEDEIAYGIHSDRTSVLKFDFSRFRLEPQNVNMGAEVYLDIYPSSATSGKPSASIQIAALYTSGNDTVNLSDLHPQRLVPPGYYKIRVRNIFYPDNTNMAHDGTIRISLDAVTPVTNKYLSSHFANGMALVQSPSDYFVPIVENGHMNFYLKSAGREYKVVNGVLSVEGVIQPQLLWRGLIRPGSNNTVESWQSKNGISVTYATTGAGRHDVIIKGHGYYATPNNTLVRANGYTGNPSTANWPVHATVAGVNSVVQGGVHTATIPVFTELQSVAVNGYFVLEVFKLL